MFSSLNPFEGMFRTPQVINRQLFSGKLPVEAFDLKGPGIDLGYFTWEPIDVGRYPIAFPLSGRATAICLMKLASSSVFAASILPEEGGYPGFASSDRVAAALSEFIAGQPERVHARVLVSTEADPKVNKTIAGILQRLGIPVNNVAVLQAQHSPALHPILKDGEFFTVDSRVIVSMSGHQTCRPRPAWAPIRLE